ncbi:DUF2314 domain-containing protein [Marinilabiliaceae bacterium JC017]|nr:DUF2314 domain-containing protein [Marinilabiliaceae bacterium JC017]
MTDSDIYYSAGDDAEMIKAYSKAQETFKYFWRELSWEFRRIVPALDLTCVKIAFRQETNEANAPIIEHMWINDIDFDGEIVSGTLINTPNELTNIKNGDFVQVPLSQVSDWLFSCKNKSYGGFTIQLLRSQMDDNARKGHDEAWGLDFGDFNDVLVVYEQKEHPENLIEHPMSVNMRDSLKDFIKSNPDELTNKDELGYTFLHRETIAGNKTSVEVLLESGVDLNTKTQSGKTALDFAKQLKWEHIIPILEN